MENSRHVGLFLGLRKNFVLYPHLWGPMRLSSLKVFLSSVCEFLFFRVESGLWIAML